ncbi:MAG: L-threonylcarbamoyladenylate synthase [Cyclobacteriaceae bacterium]|jgi:L-threonylcarbamoyladenylate synthase|nr:threonylcarbamoyl-AMP synthase [Flammeovirgaceae bacterium]
MAELGKDINRAKQLLDRGELVAIPTETVYGLAANALDATAAARIFAAKNRPSFDPLIVHVATAMRVHELVTDFPDQAQALAATFWPGPLTLVLPKKNHIPDLVTAGLPTVGVRCPSHELTLELLHLLDYPLAAPSANPFGYVSPTRPEHVQEQLGSRVAYILDGGPCRVGVESTIVGFDDGPVIYRLGGVAVEEIENVVGRVRVMTHSSSNPVAPGQLASHYAPARQIVLGNIAELLTQHPNEKLALLRYHKRLPDTPVPQIVLSSSGSLEEAAQNLFAALRQFDKMDVTLVLAELVPDTGIGRAINDRLRRAATSR